MLKMSTLGLELKGKSCSNTGETCSFIERSGSNRPRWVRTIPCPGPQKRVAGNPGVGGGTWRKVKADSEDLLPPCARRGGSSGVGQELACRPAGAEPLVALALLFDHLA